MTETYQNSSLKKKAVKSIFWLGGAKFAGQAVSWLLTIFLIRILSPEDFGLLGMAAVYQAVIIIIYDLNLGSAIVQKPDFQPKDASTCFWFIFSLSSLLYGVTWCISPYVAAFFGNTMVIPILRVYAIGTVLDSFQIVPFWLLSRQLDFDKRAKAEFSSNLVQGVLQLSLAAKGFGVWSLVYGHIAKYIILCILIFWLSRWKPEKTFQLHRLMQMLQFSVPLTGSKLMRLIADRADTIIIGRLFDAVSLGYYRVAMDLSRIPQDKIMTIINQIAYPTFSRLQGDLKGFRHYFLRLNYLLVLLMLPIFAGGVILAGELVTILLSEKWIPIKIPFQIFCLLGLMQCLNMYYFMLLNARGRSGINFRFSTLSAVVLPISFLVGSRYGIVGVCYAWLAAFPLLFFYILHLCLKEIKLGGVEYFKSMFHPICATISMSAVVIFIKFFLPNISLPMLLIIIFFAVGVYFLYFMIFSRKTFIIIGDIFETAGIHLKLKQLIVKI